MENLTIGDILTIGKELTVTGLLFGLVIALVTERLVPIGRLRDKEKECKAWQDIALTATPALKRLSEKE